MRPKSSLAYFIIFKLTILKENIFFLESEEFSDEQQKN